ncbi:hypothetical protein EVAR_31625_1 [Eumeta japonica]|uniref:Uncharacterized protein n=1 Tax=Eumeta variegata TaxID=151549 RepID=A0A4C1VZC6_EUMVA|nr:hypothetical protein EVAR_31625_1 [Eumeta japonica]
MLHTNIHLPIGALNLNVEEPKDDEKKSKYSNFLTISRRHYGNSSFRAITVSLVNTLPPFRYQLPRTPAPVAYERAPINAKTDRVARRNPKPAASGR